MSAVPIAPVGAARVQAKADAARPRPRPAKAEPSEPWRPSVIRGSDLMRKTMPDVAFLHRPFVPEGVMILAGRPKLGKTSLVRQWTVAIATGGELWGSACTRAEVLFLSLEEGEKLMQRKVGLAGYQPSELDSVAFSFAWRQGAAGCADLDAYLEAAPATRLVVIDSLTRFREPPTRDKQAFQADYEAVSQLSELAKRRPGLAIVIVHHTRKAVSGNDPIDDISGTYGVSAAADSWAVLRKQGNEYVLHCGGRYWDEQEDAFTLERDSGRWNLAGAHDGVVLSPVQRAYFDRLVADGTVSTQGMAMRFSVKKQTASEVLGELLAKGLVERTSDGWTLSDQGRRRVR